MASTRWKHIVVRKEMQVSWLEAQPLAWKEKARKALDLKRIKKNWELPASDPVLSAAGRLMTRVEDWLRKMEVELSAEDCNNLMVEMKPNPIHWKRQRSIRDSKYTRDMACWEENCILVQEDKDKAAAWKRGTITINSKRWIWCSWIRCIDRCLDKLWQRWRRKHD